MKNDLRTIFARTLLCLALLTIGWQLPAQPPPPVQPAAGAQPGAGAQPAAGTQAGAQPGAGVQAGVQPGGTPQPPFWNEIAEFKRRDSIQRPPANAILFVGSSSFRRWTNVQEYFPGYTIINRGFGGSTLDDVIRYAPAIIYPYHPRQVVVYCGDNDLAFGKKATGKKVYKKFVRLYDMIRKRLGNDVDIVFVSIKPSPGREALMPEMEQANDLIRNFIAQRAHAAFVDVYHLMLTPDGRPIDNLFEGNKLQMNEKGYKIWQQAILPYLDK
jgi:lysophospholipase L1-like esterase